MSVWRYVPGQANHGQYDRAAKQVAAQMILMCVEHRS